jgi:multidrug efflux pump subunit AcrA (membrane-fusion protein)
MSETANDYEDLLEEGEHRWRNRFVGLVVLAALVAAGAYALWAMVLGGGSSSGEETQTATVQRGSITNTISTSGVVVAQSTVDLSFGQSGLVTALNVILGQEVKQGDVLAEIESDALESAVATAELNLTSAQSKLNELVEGSDASDLASADQSLLQAQANYDKAESALEDLLDGPSESELRSAELAVTSAESQLAKAEDSRTMVYSTSDDAIAAAEEAVERAQDALDNAELAADSAANGVSSAEAALYSAETDYCGSSEEDVSRCAARSDYCYGLDYDVSFCAKRAAPVSSEDQDVLQDVTAGGESEVTAGGDRGAAAGGEAERAAKAASVVAANASYMNALASKNSADDAVDAAEEDVEAAQSDLVEAKEGPSSADIAAADVAVESAQLSLDEANASLAELKEGPTQDDLDEAQSNLDQAAAALAVAQAKWDDVYDGPDALDIELQRDQVRQAELSLEQAREDLEKAQLIAPFDGTVAELNIELGEEVSTGGQQAAIVLNTPDALRLDLTITESDRPSVEAGQSGVAYFDAIGETPFPFVIDSVGTNPTTTQGVVTYEARATMQSLESAFAARMPSGEVPGASASPQAGIPDAEGMPEEALEQFAARMETDATPLPGMNASVTITVEQVQDVLIVSAQAIQTEGFRSVVEVLNDDGSTEKVAVQTGLSDGTNTEITEGLEEGQTVIVPVRAATSVETTTTTGFPQGGFPQGGFFEGGPRGEGATP